MRNHLILVVLYYSNNRLVNRVILEQGLAVPNVGLHSLLVIQQLFSTSAVIPQLSRSILDIFWIYSVYILDSKQYRICNVIGLL